MSRLREDLVRPPVRAGAGIGLALIAVVVTLVFTDGGSIASAQVRTRLVVGYTSVGLPRASALESRLGARLIARIERLRADVLAIDPVRADEALDAFRAAPGVLYAQLDSEVHALRIPNDPIWGTQWSPLKTEAPRAWDLTTGSPVVVAVIDTGIDPTQPDLAGKLVPGFDFVHNDAAPLDDNGHGTAVAGIVAANSDNGLGVAGYCWGCRVMPVKVLGADGTGYQSDVAQGIVWAVDHGARVINASLGGPDSDAALAAAAQYADKQGALVVAAAGNDGSSTLDYPAALPAVLSVSASDEQDRLYPFSNSGALLSAPGENSTTATGGKYEYFLGTSSAAPVVSGIAGLAFSFAPSATPAAVTQALESGAVPIQGVAHGRVDAYRTLLALSPLAPALPAPVPPSPSSKRSTERGVAYQSRRIGGKLTSSRRSWAHSLSTAAGIVEVTIMTQVGRRVGIRLSLVRSDGRVVEAVRGAGRLRLRVAVARSNYRLFLQEQSAASVRFKGVIRYPVAK